MAHVYKATEWESNGTWSCGDISALAAMSNAWWYPANILGLSPVDYVKTLISKYHAVNFHYTAKHNVLIFSFSTLADCRKFKNEINKKAREQNFVTY